MKVAKYLYDNEVNYSKITLLIMLSDEWILNDQNIKDD